MTNMAEALIAAKDRMDDAKSTREQRKNVFMIAQAQYESGHSERVGAAIKLLAVKR